MDGQIDGQTRWNQYTPHFNFVEVGGMRKLLSEAAGFEHVFVGRNKRLDISQVQWIILTMPDDVYIIPKKDASRHNQQWTNAIQ